VWNPHEPLTAGQRRALGAAGVVGTLVLWSAASLFLQHVAYAAEADPAAKAAYFFPAPWTVGAKLLAMLQAEGDRNLVVAALASTRRVVSAAGLVVLLGTPIGILMGASPRINGVLSPIVDPLRSTPMVALLPIVTLWFGIEETAKVGFLGLGAAVFLVPMVRDAIVAVPREHLVLAEDLGARPLEALRHSVLPLALPRMFDAVIVAVSIEWTYITVAEFMNAKAGLGYLIQTGRRFADTAGMFAAILVILLLALITDQSLKWAKRKLFPWEGEI